MEQSLFVTPIFKQIPILLIDASGSTVGKFNQHTVLDQIKTVIKGLPEDQFRIIWWNSDQQKPASADDKFTNGICKLSFVVKKNTIDQTFLFIKPSIKNYCLTFPHLGFESIPDEWISKLDQTKVYFITDGEIGYGYPTCKMFIQKKHRDILVKKYLNCFTVRLATK